MIVIAAFKKEDLVELASGKEGTDYHTSIARKENIDVLETSEYAYTGRCSETGKILVCGGVIETWPGRGMGWALLGDDIAKHMVSIHRIAKRVLKVCDINRIEAYVEYDFSQGHRWADILGFNMEAERMKSFLPTGADATLYAKVGGG